MDAGKALQGWRLLLSKGYPHWRTAALPGAHTWRQIVVGTAAAVRTHIGLCPTHLRLLSCVPVMLVSVHSAQPESESGSSAE